MATLPKFSFSGWSSQSIAPKVNPASVPITTPGLAAPGTTVAPTTAPGQLVAQTSAANTNLPAWLQAEVDRINAQDALRTQLMGSVTGGGGGGPAFDPQIGAAALTDARARYNAQVNQMNEQSRLQSLVQQRNQIRPQGFGFTNPFDVNRLIGLGNQIQDYQNVNLPLASSAVSGIRRNTSGWVQPMWA